MRNVRKCKKLSKELSNKKQRNKHSLNEQACFAPFQCQSMTEVIGRNSDLAGNAANLELHPCNKSLSWAVLMQLPQLKLQVGLAMVNVHTEGTQHLQ